MKLWMVLVVLVCAEAKTPVKDVEVELGKSIKLDCSVEVQKTSWFMKVHSGFQTWIGRNVDVDGKNIQYYVFPHVNKFLIRRNKLQVLNITQQDLRVYCCGERPNRTKVQCKDSYRLKLVHYSTVASIAPCPNNSETNVQMWSKLVVFCFIGLSLAFVIITGLLVHSPLTSDAETLVTVQYEKDLPTDGDPGPAGPSVPVPPRFLSRTKSKQFAFKPRTGD